MAIIIGSNAKPSLERLAFKGTSKNCFFCLIPIPSPKEKGIYGVFRGTLKLCYYWKPAAEKRV